MTDELWKQFPFGLTTVDISEIFKLIPEVKVSQEPKQTNKVDYASFEGIKDNFTLNSNISSQTCSTGMTPLGSGLVTDVKVNTCTGSISGIIHNRLDDFTTKEDVEKLTETMKQDIEGKIKDKIVEELSKMIVNKNTKDLKNYKVEVEKTSYTKSEVQATSMTMEFPLLVAPAIRHIEYKDEPGKEQVTVIFEDLSHVTTKCTGGDQFDINVGVALAVLEKMFGSKSAFRKYVKEKNSTDRRRARQATREEKKEAAKKANKTKKIGF